MPTALPRLLTAVLLALLLVVPAAHARTAKVPKDFFGMAADGPLVEVKGLMSPELRLMRRAGVSSIRSAISWKIVQPYQTTAEIPIGQAPRFRDVQGTPTDWSSVDRLVTGAARQRMPILPVIVDAPDWAETTPGDFIHPPKDFDAYARFVGAVVRRYGPAGEFWREQPALPRLKLREWQVWNEPNGPFYWRDGTIRQYVAMLRKARAAIKAADPKAKVVLAGLFDFSPPVLASIYRAGARNLFDVVAIHPFTKKVSNVIFTLEQARKVMRRYGDGRKPMYVTETTWNSSKGKIKEEYGFETTEKGQAKLLTEAFTAYAANRKRLRLERVYWYSWMTYENARGDFPFSFAGLRRFRESGVQSKPSYRAFRGITSRLLP